MTPAVLSALADPTRLAVMREPRHGNGHGARYLMRRRDVTQGRISRNMKALEQGGDAVDGGVHYRIRPARPPLLRVLLAAAPIDEVAA